MRVRVAVLLCCSFLTTNLCAQTTPPPADEPFAILELGVSKELKWTEIQTPDVAIALTIENRQSATVKKGKQEVAAPPDEIQVEVTAFQGSGRSKPALIDGQASPKKISIPRQATAPVTLTASLPAAGTYTARVQLRIAGEVVSRGTIVVERKRAAAPIEVSTPPAQQMTVAGAPKSAAFEVRLVATGEDVKLAKPALRGVTYKEKADSEVAIPAKNVTLAETTDLTATQTETPITLTLNSIENAGRYDAVVRFGGTGYSGTDIPLVAYARDTCWYAFLAIFAGLMVSFFLRTFTNVLRPRLFNERRVATLYSELTEHSTLAGEDATAVGVLQRVRRSLTDRFNMLSAEGKLSDGAAFEVDDLRVTLAGLWVALRKRVARIEPAELRKPFADKLSTAEQVIVNRIADAAALNAQIAILDAMPNDIDNAIRERLEKEVDEFEKQLQKDQRTEVAPIRDAIPAIRDHLQNGRLKPAADELDLQQRRYISVLANELALRITSVAPPGSDQQWPSVASTITAGIARVRSAATAAEASEAFRASLTLFLNTVITGLTRDVKKKIDAKSNYSARYEEVRKKLATATELIVKSELVEAWKVLDEAQNEYAAIVKEAAGGNLGAMQAAIDSLSAVAAPADAASFDATVLAGFGRSSDELQRLDAMRSITSTISAGNILYTLLVLAVAVLAGFKVLYVDNLTWGGWVSYLIAFLWGVAFDQFSHAGLIAARGRT